MAIPDDIKKLSVNEFAIAIGTFVCIVAPGFLILYLFKPNLVVTLDSFKLILFSVALTLPVVVINFIIIAACHPFLTKGALSNIPTDIDRTQVFVDAMALTFLILFPSILIAHVFYFPFRKFLIAVFILQVVVSLLLYIAFLFARKRNL